MMFGLFFLKRNQQTYIHIYNISIDFFQLDYSYGTRSISSPTLTEPIFISFLFNWERGRLSVGETKEDIMIELTH